MTVYIGTAGYQGVRDVKHMVAPETRATIETVGLNYRYSSIWNEVNARIAQRQNALSMFVSLAAGIISVLFISAGTVAVDQEQMVRFDPYFFSVLLPIISVVFGFLNYKHDMTISLLRSFLSE
jgi:hypothetical protein